MLVVVALKSSTALLMARFGDNILDLSFSLVSGSVLCDSNHFSMTVRS